MTSKFLLLIATVAVGCGGDPAVPDQPAPPPEPHVLVRESATAKLPVQGTVNVVTLKNGTAEVPGRFEHVSGEVTLADVDTWQGLDGAIVVDLSSWNSDVELRDQRVRDIFFDVAQYGEATLSLSGLTGLTSGGIKIGQTANAGVRGKITMHGITRDVAIAVAIERAGKDAFMITTPTPFEVKISDYQFGDSLAALIKECGHKSVGDVVQVMVDLKLGHVAQIPAEKLPDEGAPPAGDPGPGAKGTKGVRAPK